MIDKVTTGPRQKSRTGSVTSRTPICYASTEHWSYFSASLINTTGHGPATTSHHSLGSPA
jgi:hypothetical protein